MAGRGYRRRGRAEADVLSRVQDKVIRPVVSEPEKESGSTGTEEKRSWLNIITSVDGKDLSAQVDPRFGRARGFLLIDQESTDDQR